MKVAVVVGGLFVAVAAAACVQAAATASGRPPVESCADAIYTTPANAPPKPVQAVKLGAAVFNSLAHLTTQRRLDKPTKAFPFYTVKSPLTILARARLGVTITLVGGGNNVALLYSRTWLQRLPAWHYTLADVPNSVRLPLCTDTNTELPLNTQYAGGFLLRKPDCVTIEVQAVGESKTHRATVPIGVSGC